MLRKFEDKAVRPQEDKLVRCDCCSTPVCAIEGDSLVIRSNHHGERHVTRIPLANLIVDRPKCNRYNVGKQENE